MVLQLACRANRYMKKARKVSFTVLPQPSAILAGIDKDERLIWLVNP